jgi:rhodanese-related sulfurtransferase
MAGISYWVGRTDTTPYVAPFASPSPDIMVIATMLFRTSILLLLAAFSAFTQTGTDKPTDPWEPSVIIKPADLAERLKAGDKPVILYVGFPVLYKGAHIPGAEFAGPCSKPEGLAALAKAASALPHDKEIVIYCGCCPFVKCPNIRPAYSALKSAGYTHVRVLQLDTNLHTDWVEKNYPVEGHPAQ